MLQAATMLSWMSLTWQPGSAPICLSALMVEPAMPPALWATLEHQRPSARATPGTSQAHAPLTVSPTESSAAVDSSDVASCRKIDLRSFGPQPLLSRLLYEALCNLAVPAECNQISSWLASQQNCLLWRDFCCHAGVSAQ